MEGFGGTSKAAGVGFEPTRRLTAPSGFQDRPDQPLRHPAVVHDARVWERVDVPRRWLVLAVAALLASFFPYWHYVGTGGITINAALVLVATAALFKNVRGERRLQDAEAAQRRAIDGAPNSTSDPGTSTDPSSRW